MREKLYLCAENKLYRKSNNINLMNKKGLLLILSSLIVGLITFSSCSKGNTLNDLEGTTFVPKEQLSDNQTELELFFESGTELDIKVKELDLPKDLIQIDNEQLDWIKQSGLLAINFRLAYTYDKITREIKISKTDNTISNASAQIEALIAKFINEQMKGQSDIEKALLITLAKAKLTPELNKAIDQILKEIESIIYNEEADEIILRVKKDGEKESEVVIFKQKD